MKRILLASCLIIGSSFSAAQAQNVGTALPGGWSIVTHVASSDAGFVNSGVKQLITLMCPPANTVGQCIPLGAAEVKSPSILGTVANIAQSVSEPVAAMLWRPPVTNNNVSAGASTYDASTTLNATSANAQGGKGGQGGESYSNSSSQIGNNDYSYRDNSYTDNSYNPSVLSLGSGSVTVPPPPPPPPAPGGKG